jgi:hypothetical protein
MRLHLLRNTGMPLKSKFQEQHFISLFSGPVFAVPFGRLFPLGRASLKFPFFVSGLGMIGPFVLG